MASVPGRVKPPFTEMGSLWGGGAGFRRRIRSLVWDLFTLEGLNGVLVKMSELRRQLGIPAGCPGRGGCRGLIQLLREDI